MTILAVMDGPPRLDPESKAWGHIVKGVRTAAPDVLLMNEMPFGGWIANQPDPNPAVLQTAHAVHETGNERLHELEVQCVLSTRPTTVDDRSVNQAFVWSRSDGMQPVHTKQFFPDEEGFYEARWWQPGEMKFALGNAAGLQVGFLICTDVQFLEHARHYGRRGAHLIAVPRAVTASTLEKWKTVMRAAAITSGCYVASSNRSGIDPETKMEFGGGSWIISPEGDVLAATDPDHQVVTADIDKSIAERAKHEYPCYVTDAQNTPK